MNGIALWIRRGAGAPVAVALAGFTLTTVFSQGHWQVEWDWGTRLSAASVIIACPLVAAAAAHDTARRYRPTVAELAKASARRGSQALAPALAVALCAGAAYVLTWLAVAVAVLRRGGVGPTDYWVYAEVLLPILVSSLVGACVGLVVDGFLAAPAAVLAVLATLVIAAPFGRGPFEAVTTYGTLTGLQRTPSRAMLSLAGLLVLGGGLVLASSWLTAVRRPRSFLWVLLAPVVAVAVVLPAAWPLDSQVYEVSTEQVRCVGRHPAVCGPTSRLPLLEPVQTSLADSYHTLDGTQFVAPQRFTVARLDQYAKLGSAAPLDFDPANLTAQGYSPQATARALARPHQCAELFSAKEAGPLLDAQDVVQGWLVAVLVGQTPPKPVPSDVTSAFEAILSCHVMRGDLT